MKRFKIFDMIKCFFQKKSDRCEGCRLEQAAMSLPYGIKENAEALINDVLEPVREEYGKPILVVNGFICPARMKNNGSPHVKGEAADIMAAGLTGSDLWLENLELAKVVMKVGHFDMMVLGDVPSDSIEPKWIKVTWKRNGTNMGMVLKKVAGKAEYESLSKLDMMQLEAD